MQFSDAEPDRYRQRGCHSLISTSLLTVSTSYYAIAKPSTVGDASQYWTTAAQVMPVLALAIVVEARATIQGWNKGVPRAVKAIQGILWCAPLTIFWWAEAQAFSELAGTSVPHYWITITQMAIGASLSALLLTPMIGLLAATNARLLAGGIFSIRSLRHKIMAAIKQNCIPAFISYRIMNLCPQFLLIRASARSSLTGRSAATP